MYISLSGSCLMAESCCYVFWRWQFYVGDGLAREACAAQ
jgi:hypothetical protein